MQNLLSSIVKQWEILNNNGYIILFLLAVVLLTINFKYLKRNKWLAYFVFLSLLTVTSPIWGISISNIYGLLPFALVIGWIATIAVSKQKIAWKKLIALITIIFLIMSSGARLDPIRLYQKIDNKEQVSEFAVLICETITKETDTPKIAVPERFAGSLRQYNGKVELLFSVQGVEGWYDSTDENIEYVRNEIDQESPDMETLITIIKEYDCHYIMLHRNQVAEDTPDNYGFIEEEEIGDYYIYKNTQGVK